MLTPLEIALGLQQAAAGVAREASRELVLQHAVDGVVHVEGLSLARVWMVEKGALVLNTVAASGVAGSTDGAGEWAKRVALDRAMFSSNRLYHGMGTPDVGWMRSNKFRSFVGVPLHQENGQRGVFDCFGLRPLLDDAIKSIESYVQHLEIRLNDLTSREDDTPREAVEIPTNVSYDEAERQFVQAVLARFGGQIEGHDGAAASLGLAPSTLRSRLKRLGVR